MAPLLSRRFALKLAGGLFGTLAAPAILRAQTPHRIRIGYNTAVDFVGAFLAEDQGIFRRNGIQVEMSPVGPTAMVPSVVTNSVDMVTLSSLPSIQAIDAGLPMTMIVGGQVLPCTGNIGMMARVGANLKTPEDLFGKRLAVPALNNIMLYMFNYWFSQKGLDYRRLKWIEAPAVNYRDMMRRGEIDAALLFDPYFQMLRKEGIATDFIDFYDKAPPGVVVGGYQANRDWVKANPEAVAAFRASLEEGSALALRDHALARTSITKWTRMSLELVETIAVPNLLPRVQASNLDYVLTVMRQQGLLKTNITAENILWPWPT
jgi:NitT/TauT family transport system substrate-binding protein